MKMEMKMKMQDDVTVVKMQDDVPSDAYKEAITNMYHRIAMPVPVWKICCPSLSHKYVRQKYLVAQETGGRTPIQETSNDNCNSKVFSNQCSTEEA